MRVRFRSRAGSALSERLNADKYIARCIGEATVIVNDIYILAIVNVIKIARPGVFGF